jgi:hypothetical protein
MMLIELPLENYLLRKKVDTCRVLRVFMNSRPNLYCAPKAPHQYGRKEDVMDARDLFRARVLMMTYLIT